MQLLYALWAFSIALSPYVDARPGLSPPTERARSNVGRDLSSDRQQDHGLRARLMNIQRDSISDSAHTDSQGGETGWEADYTTPVSLSASDWGDDVPSDPNSIKSDPEGITETEAQLVTSKVEGLFLQYYNDFPNGYSYGDPIRLYDDLDEEKVENEGDGYCAILATFSHHLADGDHLSDDITSYSVISGPYVPESGGGGGEDSAYNPGDDVNVMQHLARAIEGGSESEGIYTLASQHGEPYRTVFEFKTIRIVRDDSSSEGSGEQASGSESQGSQDGDSNAGGDDSDSDSGGNLDDFEITVGVHTFSLKDGPAQPYFAVPRRRNQNAQAPQDPRAYSLVLA